MDRRMWVWSGLAVLAIAFAPVLAGEKESPKPGASVVILGEKPTGEKHEKVKSPYGEFALMASELKLTEEQKQKLEDLVKANLEEMAAWQKENGQRLADLQKAMGELKKAENRDEQKMKDLGSQQNALLQEMAKLRDKHQAAVMAILTPEQQAEWKTLRIYQGIIGKYGKLDLTEDQKARIKAICGEFAKELDRRMAEAPKEGKEGKEGKGEKGTGEMWQRFQADINDVLTPEQKAKLESSKKEGGKEGGKKEGEGKEGPKPGGVK